MSRERNTWITWGAVAAFAIAFGQQAHLIG